MTCTCLHGGEGVSPSPPGEGSGEGAMPPPQKNFEICIPKWWVLVQYEVLFATFHSLFLHANWNFNSTHYPIIIPFTPICLTYSFWSVKPAAYGFWLIVVPLLYHSVIPLNFATSCLHNVDVPCTDKHSNRLSRSAEEASMRISWTQIQNAIAMQSVVTQRGSTYVTRQQ